MKKRRLLFGIAAILSGVSAVFRSCGHFTAHAADVVQLTPGQTRALFGDTLTGSYYNDSTGDYEACTFTYLGTTALAGRSPMRESYATPFDRISPTGSAYLIYQSDFQGLSTVRPYYSVRFNPIISLGMLQRFSMVAGLSSMAVQVHEDPEDETSPLIWDTAVENCSESRGGYPENYWSALQNGNRVGSNSCDAWTTGSNLLDWLHWGIAWTAQTNRRFFIPNVIDLSSDSYFSVSDIQITRQGNCKAVDSASARTLLYISCPILTQDYTDNNAGGDTGTDLTATNMKLDTIIEILSRIANDEAEDDSDDGDEPVNDAETYEPSENFVDDMDSALDDADALMRSTPDLSGSDSILGYIWDIFVIMHLDRIFSSIAIIFILRWVFFHKKGG